jgi:hypothetical protein
MYAIIDVGNGSIVDVGFSLPFKKELPDGGMALFEKAGQAEPSHAPRYKVVPVKEAVAKPGYPVREIASGQVFDGKDVVLTKTYAPDVSAFQHAIEAHIEAVAATREYSSAVSLASYAASTIEQWQAEAVAFIAWRDAVWTYVLTELGKAQAGQRQIPLVHALIAELPAIEWPEAK